MKQPTRQPKKIQIGRLKVPRKLFIVLCVCIVVAVGYWFVDYQARQRFSSLKTEMGTIARDVMQPAGAAEQHISFTGENFFNTTGCIDVECPSYEELWVVPIEQGQESAFADSLLQRMGYGPSPYFSNGNDLCANNSVHFSCSRTGRKGSFDITVGIEEADNSHHRIPEREVAPKIWRAVGISLNLANGQ